MSSPAKYTMPLDQLVDSVRVPLEEQVEEQATTSSQEQDDSAGHLPGNVRPYGA